MPSAEVVADRFHVMKQINQELDEQRRAEKRAVEAQKNKKQKAEKEAKLEVLKRSKYSLLKNEKDLTETQKIKLEAIKEKLTNLKKMQELKEEFRKIYETSNNPTEGLLKYTSANFFDKGRPSTLLKTLQISNKCVTLLVFHHASFQQHL